LTFEEKQLTEMLVMMLLYLIYYAFIDMNLYN